MTNPKARAQAENDLSDINAIRSLPGWERYYMRRLEEKRLELEKEALRGLTVESREKARTLLVFLEDDVISMVDTDHKTHEAACLAD